MREQPRDAPTASAAGTDGKQVPHRLQPGSPGVPFRTGVCIRCPHRHAMALLMPLFGGRLNQQQSGGLRCTGLAGATILAGATRSGLCCRFSGLTTVDQAWAHLP